jgi:cytochrome b
MMMMFPIVVAVTLLLAFGEIATNEARRARFAPR